MQLINATPHDYTHITPDGETTIPPSGLIARVDREIEPGDPIILDDGHEIQTVWVRPGRLVWERDGQPVPAPEIRPNVDYVVSAQAAQAAAWRGDLLAPDELVRDRAGVVTGARRLARPVDARILRSVARYEQDLACIVHVGPVHVGIRVDRRDDLQIVAAVQAVVDREPVGAMTQALALAAVLSRDPDTGHGYVMLGEGGITVPQGAGEQVITPESWELYWALIRTLADELQRGDAEDDVTYCYERLVLQRRSRRWERLGKRHDISPEDPAVAIAGVPYPQGARMICGICQRTWQILTEAGDMRPEGSPAGVGEENYWRSGPCPGPRPPRREELIEQLP